MNTFVGEQHLRPVEQPNGLALEYQREYGTAHGELDVFDLVNNPEANGLCRVNFSKKGADHADEES